MSKLKKVLLTCTAYVLVAALAIGGTIAYLTDTDSDVNVMTLGNVSIRQNEQQRVEKDGVFTSELENFKQGKALLPYTTRDGGNDLLTVGEHTFERGDSYNNYIDKIVSVTNTGKTDAFVRTLIAIPTGGANWEPEPVAAADVWLHWNVIQPFLDHWYSSYNKPDDYKSVLVEIGGKGYYVWEFTHKNALKPEETSFPTLMGCFMDNRVDHDEDGYYMDMNSNGAWDNGERRIEDLEIGATTEILVLSQAVQTAGFADPQTALDTAFGDVTTAKAAEWFGGMNIPTVVSTAADLQNAMKTDGATIVLKDDIVVTADDTTGYGQHMFLANGKSVTIDLNGYEITIAEDASQVGSAFTVANGGKIILEGDGTVEIKNGKAFIGWTLNNSGSIEVRGGNYFGNGHEGNNALFYVQDNAGKIDVCGGKFTYPIANNDNWGFNAHNGIGDKVVIEIHEGTLLQHEQFQYGDNSRIQLAEGCSLEETVIDGETWYQVVK